MRFSRGRIHWYDVLLLAIAALIVYPDRVVLWLGERFGRNFGWGHVIAVEVVAVGALIATMNYLIPRYPQVEWWLAGLYVGMLALFRFLSWVVRQMFGFDD